MVPPEQLNITGDRISYTKLVKGNIKSIVWIPSILEYVIVPNEISNADNVVNFFENVDWSVYSESTKYENSSGYDFVFFLSNGERIKSVRSR